MRRLSEFSVIIVLALSAFYEDVITLSSLYDL